MSIIKAPFNFVTLSDKVFFPEWADKISQDIPFSDGLSGTINLPSRLNRRYSYVMVIRTKATRQ